MSMRQWLDWMATNHPKAIRLGLSKLKPIAKELSLTNFDYPVIVVGGTNGKGSCIKVIESILLNAKLKVGVYTSPHLLKYNERVRINGSDISDEDCIFAFKSLKKITDKLNINLTFFEFATLSALINFKNTKLDVLVLEIGLGGRLDAVNIVENDISVITSISFDHMDFLGDSLDSIAFEKAGIFRKNKIGIYGEPNHNKVILDKAAELNLDFSVFNRDFFAEYKVNNLWQYKSSCSCSSSILLKQSDLQYRRNISNYNSGHSCNGANNNGYDYDSNNNDVNNHDSNNNLKEKQFIIDNIQKTDLLLQNVATGIRATEKLIQVFRNKFNKDINITKDIIKKSIENINFPGRFQIKKINNLEIILDVAHNEAAAKNLAINLTSLQKIKGETIAIFAAQENKDIDNIVLPFRDLIDYWHIIDIDAPRALELDILCEKLKRIIEQDKIAKCLDLENILQFKKEIEQRIVVFGSFYTVARVLKFLVDL